MLRNRRVRDVIIYHTNNLVRGGSSSSFGLGLGLERRLYSSIPDDRSNEGEDGHGHGHGGVAQPQPQPHHRRFYKDDKQHGRDFDNRGGRQQQNRKRGFDYNNNNTRGPGGAPDLNRGDSRRYSFPSPVDGGDEMKQTRQPRDRADDDGFLEKFKLGAAFDQLERKQKPPSSSYQPPAEPQPQVLQLEEEQTEDGRGCQGNEAEDANSIFKEMKETGLIPNAVAMLHGLCTDGLVQEAMKLFGSMREKGTIPEVVIYTAVVEGFCKAQKFDDALRIFRKMQGNGVSPNAFSYSVLVQGLCRGQRLDDALAFCVEMLEAGHSPNLATFLGMVDGFCRDRGLEAAQTMIATLRHKGFFLDEKAVREFLDKKGPFLPVVWESIFGKKNSSVSQRFL